MTRIQFLTSLAALSLFATACDDDESSSTSSADSSDNTDNSRDTGASLDTSVSDDTASGTDAGSSTDTSTGSPDVAETVPCGEITFAGECEGDTLRYCDTQNDTLIESDCSQVTVGDPAVAATCGFVEEEYGFDCVFPVGAPCLTGTGEDLQILLCAGTEPGCVLGATAATCTENLGTCTPPGEGEEFAASCNGDLLNVSCQINQPVAYDCAALSGSCSEGTCVGIPEGGTCDGELILCAEGFACTEGTCTAQ